MLMNDGLVAFRLRFGLDGGGLADTETTIGRDPSCSVSIDDDLVSRTHAVFRRRDGFVEAVDLGSRNGTRVNGVVIREPTRLSHGDRIRVGPREMVFYDTDRVRGGERRQNSTGRMAMCVRCEEVIPG